MGKEKYLDFHRDESHQTSTLTEKSILGGGHLLKLVEKWQGTEKYFLLSLIAGLGTLFENIMQEQF